MKLNKQSFTLNKKISKKFFFISQLLILVFGLIFIGGLYYILNIQYEEPKRPFLAGPVTTAPKSLKLDLDQPEPDSLSYSSSVVVSGNTSSSREVLIFTENNDLVVKSKADGSFSTVLDLKEGVNKITAVVFDSRGEFRSAERTVYYSKEKI